MLTNNADATTRTSDTATCATTSVLVNGAWAVPRCRVRVIRSVRVDRTAGSKPKSTVVVSAMTALNASTRQSRPGSICTGSPHGLQISNRLVPHCASARPPRLPNAASKEALGQQLTHEPSAIDTEREPRRDLPLPRHATGEQESGEVQAGDQEHQRATGRQQVQRTRVAPPCVHQSLCATLGAQRRRVLQRARDVAILLVGVRGHGLLPLEQQRLSHRSLERRCRFFRRHVRPQPPHHVHPQEGGSIQLGAIAFQ